MSFESVKARKNKPSYGTKLDLWDKLIIGSSENLRIGAPGEIRTPDPLVRSHVAPLFQLVSPRFQMYPISLIFIMILTCSSALV